MCMRISSLVIFKEAKSTYLHLIIRRMLQVRWGQSKRGQGKRNDVKIEEGY